MPFSSLSLFASDYVGDGEGDDQKTKNQQNSFSLSEKLNEPKHHHDTSSNQAQPLCPPRHNPRSSSAQEITIKLPLEPLILYDVS
jgi:hypothetical protein